MFDWLGLWDSARRYGYDEGEQAAADHLRTAISEAFVPRADYDQRGVAFMDAAKKLNAEFDRAEAAAEIRTLRARLAEAEGERAAVVDWLTKNSAQTFDVCCSSMLLVAADAIEAGKHREPDDD